MSKKLKRLNELVSFLKENNGASTKTLAEMFNVSEMTIRRDLNVLKKHNIVNLVRGAAIYNNGDFLPVDNSKYELFTEKDKQANEKYRIGKKAVSLIEPNDVIIIDTGTTTEYVAKLLPDNLPVTVICYTANVLVEIYKKPLVKIIFAGGYYHRNSQMFESPEGIQLIKRTCATKFFVSAAGISKQLGVTCVNQYETENKLASIRSALTKILLADSTKFGKVRPSYFAQLSDFDIIITDSGISQDWIDFIKSLDITLYVV